MKKRLGKSPDLSDSLRLAYVEPKQGPAFSIDFFCDPMTLRLPPQMEPPCCLG